MVGQDLDDYAGDETIDRQTSASRSTLLRLILHGGTTRPFVKTRMKPSVGSISAISLNLT
ncbi:hypothetical protein ASG35_05865 [Burkholderia sp. Leaf177]|nr:hypothetical protein ASG35_05865 [Burkholderia sp. Leaf177]